MWLRNHAIIPIAIFHIHLTRQQTLLVAVVKAILNGCCTWRGRRMTVLANKVQHRSKRHKRCMNTCVSKSLREEAGNNRWGEKQNLSRRGREGVYRTSWKNKKKLCKGPGNIRHKSLGYVLRCVELVPAVHWTNTITIISKAPVHLNQPHRPQHSAKCDKI